MSSVNDQSITTWLKLPFQFDEAKLVADLKSILEKPWNPHFNTDGYEGDWTSLALLSVNGDANNILAMHADDAALQETDILKRSEYLKEVLYHFKCTITSARLLKLSAGAYIKPHRDHALGYEDACFRLHVPITTSDQVKFKLNGDHLTMQPGDCWYTNVNYEHSVANRGTTDRVHLVIDGERNAWSDDLFFSLAPKDSFFPKQEEQYATETVRQIIEQLKELDAHAAKEMIAQYEKQLKEKP